MRVIYSAAFIIQFQPLQLLHINSKILDIIFVSLKFVWFHCSTCAFRIVRNYCLVKICYDQCSYLQEFLNTFKEKYKLHPMLHIITIWAISLKIKHICTQSEFETTHYNRILSFLATTVNNVMHYVDESKKLFWKTAITNHNN